MPLCFLDEANRYGLHVVVGTSESADLFLRGLYELVRRYGLRQIVFLDRWLLRGAVERVERASISSGARPPP